MKTQGLFETIDKAMQIISMATLLAIILYGAYEIMSQR